MTTERSDTTPSDGALFHGSFEQVTRGKASSADTDHADGPAARGTACGLCAESPAPWTRAATTPPHAHLAVAYTLHLCDSCEDLLDEHDREGLVARAKHLSPEEVRTIADVLSRAPRQRQTGNDLGAQS